MSGTRPLLDEAQQTRDEQSSETQTAVRRFGALNVLLSVCSLLTVIH